MIFNITINGVKLDQNNSSRLLGIQIDKHLTWTEHAETLTRELSRPSPHTINFHILIVAFLQNTSTGMEFSSESVCVCVCVFLCFFVR